MAGLNMTALDLVALGNAEFLELWEHGYRLHPLDRALLAIRTSLPPGATTDELVADWPLGRRNRALAQVRMLYFGPRLEGWTVCPQCGEKLEFEVDCGAIAEAPLPEMERRVSGSGGVYRLPTSRDLALVAGEVDAERAALQLLERCTLERNVNGKAASLTPAAIDEIAARMAEADPMAEITLGFECPVCSHASQEVLDLAAFLWSEIESRARRLLSEVHALAAAYGWAEAAILGMSDVRRATYLGMVGA
jgi:hypothetical protein